jgi:hypothetical protein
MYTSDTVPARRAQDLNAQAATINTEIAKLHNDSHSPEQGAPEWRRLALRDERIARTREFDRLFARANGWTIPRKPALLDFDDALRPMVSKNNALLARLRAAEMDLPAGYLFDHDTVFNGEGKVAAITSHPYVGEDDDTGILALEDLEDLGEVARHARCVVTVPRSPSWYYPHHTAAIIFSNEPLAWVPGGRLHLFDGR